MVFMSDENVFPHFEKGIKEDDLMFSIVTPIV